MDKIHTISIDDFIKDPIVEKVIASSTGPIYKKLIITINVITKIVMYTIEYKDRQVPHSTLSSAIKTYNSK